MNSNNIHKIEKAKTNRRKKEIKIESESVSEDRFWTHY